MYYVKAPNQQCAVIVTVFSRDDLFRHNFENKLITTMVIGPPDDHIGTFAKAVGPL